MEDLRIQRILTRAYETANSVHANEDLLRFARRPDILAYSKRPPIMIKYDRVRDKPDLTNWDSRICGS